MQRSSLLVQLQTYRLIASNFNKWTPSQAFFKDLTKILKMLLKAPPCCPYVSTQASLHQISERENPTQKEFIIIIIILWLTHFLDLVSFLHELSIWTSAQEFFEILNIREILPSSRENFSYQILKTPVQ